MALVLSTHHKGLLQLISMLIYAQRRSEEQV